MSPYPPPAAEVGPVSRISTRSLEFGRRVRAQPDRPAQSRIAVPPQDELSDVLHKDEVLSGNPFL